MRPTSSGPAPVRTLVVACPAWPVVAAGAAPGEPAAVVHANRVVAVTPAAAAHGVAPGLRRREAQARCPSVVLHRHDPARDIRAFEAVARALEALSPRLEVTGAGRCSIATRGPSRYHGGDEALAGRAAALAAGALGERVAVAGPPGVGIADGPFAAGLAADAAVAAVLRDGDGPAVVVVEPGGSPGFCAPHPLAVLGRPGLADILGRLGLYTLGDFAALDPADVAARFGADGLAAHRLAAGADSRPLDTVPPPPELEVTAELDPPADRIDRIAFCVRALAQELHGRLEALGLSCTRLAIEAESEHGERHSRLWRHEGALGPAAVADRARWQLDGWLQSSNRPTGGVALVRLVPDEVSVARGTQVGFWGGRTLADERAGRALARIQGTFGVEAVAVARVRGGRGPAEAVRAVTALGADMSGAMTTGPWPGGLPAPSPALVHAAPVAAEVLDSAGRPVTVDGRGQVSAAPAWVGVVGGGAPVGVEAWAGPWPLDERWWDPVAHRRRARFQVVLAGGTAHLLSREKGGWWVEATYD